MSGSRHRRKLAAELAGLFAFTGRGEELPPHICIVEASAALVLADGHLQVRSSLLATPQDYEVRFAELLTAGYSWINLAYAGDLDGVAVVLVETPATSSGAPTTSINYAGPTAGALERGCDARALLEIVER